jgi:hypothetical protein
MEGQMTSYEAKNILRQLKQHIRDANTLRALDKAIQVLAWQELTEQASLEDDGPIDGEIVEDSFEQPQGS